MIVHPVLLVVEVDFYSEKIDLDKINLDKIKQAHQSTADVVALLAHQSHWNRLSCWTRCCCHTDLEASWLQCSCIVGEEEAELTEESLEEQEHRSTTSGLFERSMNSATNLSSAARSMIESKSEGFVSKFHVKPRESRLVKVLVLLVIMFKHFRFPA